VDIKMIFDYIKYIINYLLKYIVFH